jgi:hypothetical protein
VELNQTTDLLLREIARTQPVRVVFVRCQLRLLAQSCGIGGRFWR